MFFLNGELLRQARIDRNLSLEALSEMAQISVESLKELEKGKFDGKVSTAALFRLEKALNLPADSLLLEPAETTIHRIVTYENFITPHGFEAWVDTLNRFVKAHLIPDGNGCYESSALPFLRESVEKQIRSKVVNLYHSGEITKGRAQELLNLTAWDELPHEEKSQS